MTRAGCSLCAQAQPVVERLANAAGVRLTVVDVDLDVDQDVGLDVDGDPALSQWRDHVPVVLLDGVEHSRWWVEERALQKALRG